MHNLRGQTSLSYQTPFFPCSIVRGSVSGEHIRQRVSYLRTSRYASQSQQAEHGLCQTPLSLNAKSALLMVLSRAISSAAAYGDFGDGFWTMAKGIGGTAPAGVPPLACSARQLCCSEIREYQAEGKWTTLGTGRPPNSASRPS